MTTRPDNVPDSLVQGFRAAMWDSLGPGYDAEPSDDDIRAGLAAVLDALKGLARVELNREVEGIRSAWRGQNAPVSETTQTGDIPAVAIDAAAAALEDAPMGAEYTDQARAAIEAARPAIERRVREQVEAELRAWRAEGHPRAVSAAIAHAARIARGPQGAPTAPAQPATDATGDTETTGGAASPTDDLSTLHHRIADALTQWVILVATGRPDAHPPHDRALRENSLARAAVVMDVIRPELEHHREVAEAALKGWKAEKDRAEKAEKERDRFKALLCDCSAGITEIGCPQHDPDGGA